MVFAEIFVWKGKYAYSFYLFPSRCVGEADGRGGGFLFVILQLHYSCPPLGCVGEADGRGECAFLQPCAPPARRAHPVIPTERNSLFLSSRPGKPFSPCHPEERSDEGSLKTKPSLSFRPRRASARRVEKSCTERKSPSENGSMHGFPLRGKLARGA